MDLLLILFIFIILVFAFVQLAWGVIKFTWKNAILFAAILILIIFLLDF